MPRMVRYTFEVYEVAIVLGDDVIYSGDNCAIFLNAKQPTKMDESVLGNIFQLRRLLSGYEIFSHCFHPFYAPQVDTQKS